MPEEGRWCGDAAEVMTFFLEIDLAAGYITETVARRSGDRLAGREFDTPGLCYVSTRHQIYINEVEEAVTNMRPWFWLRFH